MAFTIYSASAGSGKTYTLVNEYLALALPDPQRFPQILAITFTNKAAAEMKNRILLALDELRQGRNPQRIITLMEMTGLTVSVLSTHAGLLMTAILHQYGDYAVMTIDSFILRVVRAFSFDLGLPIRFDVELSQDRVTALLVDRVIARAREGHRVGEILKRFIIEKIHSQNNWNYEAELMATARQRFNDKSLEAISHLIELDDHHLLNLEKELTELRKGFTENIRSRCQAIISAIKPFGLTLSDFSYNKTGVYGQIQALAQARSKSDFEIKQNLRKGVWFKKKSPQERDFQIIFEQQIDPLRLELIDNFDRELPRYRAICDIKRSLPTLQLLKELEEELTRLGTEDRLVPISQFNRKVAEIIETEVIPYIYLRIGERFRNYLIDEFQDTNHLQWKNLFPLIENVLAEGEKSLVVGDPKQAIYRWRGGDPLIMEQEIPRQISAEMLKIRRLETNYRSHQQLVEFNNRFFGDFALEPELPAMDRFAADQVAQKIARTELPGFVEIRFFGVSPLEQEDDPTEEALQWTLNHIRQAHRSSPQGRLDYRDMAILIRNRKDALPLAQALISAGIPIVTSDSLMLNQYRPVRAVIAQLNYIHSRDTVHLLELLANLKGGGLPEFLLTLPGTDDLVDEVKRHLPRFDDWITRPTTLSLYDLIEDICSAFIPLDEASSLPESPQVPLLAFLDLVFIQLPRMNGDLSTFLDWWQVNKEEDITVITNCQSPDGIQILTIHKAKGLEFPMVIIPFADWDVVSKNMSRTPNLWIHDRENRLGQGPLHYLIPVGSENEPHLFQDAVRQEHLNNRIDSLHLLYVAFTRAQTTLLVGIRKVKTGKVSQWIKDRLALWPMADDPNRFSLGHLEYSPIQNSRTSHPPAKSRRFQSWQNRLSVRSQARDEWLDPCDPRTEGRRLHYILSRIRSESDLGPVVDRATASGIISQDQRLALINQIEALFDLPLFADTVRALFRPPWQVRTEATIRHGKSNSRPDRILFSDSEIRVIDYKRESAHPGHRPQLQSYMKLLASCYPDHQIAGALLYIVSRNTVEMTHMEIGPGERT